MTASRDRVPGSRARSARPIDVVVGVDIGGTKTSVQVAALDTGDLLDTDRFATPKGSPPRALIGALVDRVQGMLAPPTASTRRRLRALGVAVPGQVDGEGVVLGAGNLGWSRVPLRQRLEEALLVPVFVEHDANAAALAEHRSGSARRYSDFVFLALGTGVGAGIVLGGKLHRGVRSAAGEIGDFRLEPCSRGRPKKTLADQIGSRAIRDAARRSTGENLDAAEALRGAARDPRLVALLDRVADHLALAVINTTAVLDLQAVILGGGSATAGKPLLERVRARVEAALFRPPHLRLSAWGEHAQLRGAWLGALSLVQPPALPESNGGLS